MLVYRELDHIDIDDIGNIEDSPRLVFIDEEYGNLIVVHINQKKTLYNRLWVSTQRKML